MPLSFIMEKLDDVEPSIAKLYTQQDGKYVLTGIEGIAPKSKVDEFRTNNIMLSDKLKAFEGIDPVQYKQMTNELGELKIRLEKSGLDDVQIEKIVAGRVEQMSKTFTENETKYQTTITTQAETINRLMLDGATKDAAVMHGIQETALDDVIGRVRNTFKVVDGKVIGKDAQGNVIYDATGQKEITIGEWVKNLTKVAPHLFKQSVQSQIPNNLGFKGDPSKMTAIQKIQSGLAG